MEGITILKNEANNHRVMQIDFDLLSKDEEVLEDLYDMIAIEVRKEEEGVSWQEAKKKLGR